MIGRREFITLLGGAAARPVTAWAQQPDRMRRLGVLTNLTQYDAEGQARIAAFQEGLQQLGWIDGRNVRIEYRSGIGNPDRIRAAVAELVALEPNAILAAGSATVGPLLHATSTIPIVFVNVVDPVAAGYVASFARPGGNITGFTQYEYGTSAKWLELLKQVAPAVTRAAVIRDPTNPAGIGQFAAVQAMAPLLGVVVSSVDVRDAPGIERAVTAFATSSTGGLIVTGSAAAVTHRDLLIALADEVIE